jgi:hypothetical protein
MRKQILAVVFLAICPLLYAQQALNNDAVIKLVKAGLSDDLIVSTISATAGSYDTSADGLIALKTAGASDKIVVAIVAKTAAPEPPAAAAPATPATAQVGTTATVHVYRFKEFIGQALHPSIYCDGVQLGRLGMGII